MSSLASKTRTSAMLSLSGTVCSYMYLYIMSIEYKRPTLCDVYRYVVPQYAHKWRYLGALLHFEQPELEIICNNCHNDAEKCCGSLLSRWLEKNHDASWDQLLLAIDNLFPLSGTVYQGVN